MSILRAVKGASSLKRAVAPAVVRARTFISGMDAYGKNQFSGDIADEYLAKQGLAAGTLSDPKWTSTSADKVANAVMDWAGDQGASVFTHWFQPLGAGGVRTA